MEKVIFKLLEEMEEDPNREGLKDTPGRYSGFLKSFTNPVPFKFTVFDNEGYDEMIVQSNIVFYSLCEHHLLPFFGTGTIAYVPDKKIVGLSKLARTLEYYSHRLQNQERITTQVAQRLQNELMPKGVAVLIRARHMCIEMRGIQKPETKTITSRLTGVFKSRPETRTEFLQLAK